MSQLNSTPFVLGGTTTSGFVTEGLRGPFRYKYLTTQDDSVMERADVAGVNVRELPGSGMAQLISRVSHRDYDTIKFSQGDKSVAEIELLLSQLCKKGGKGWRDYMSTRVARKFHDNVYGTSYSVVRNYDPSYPPPSEVKTTVKSSGIGGPKKYTLAQFFSDTAVTDKYGLPIRLMRDIKALAITRPADAAASLQQALNERSPGRKIEVTAGQYSNSRKSARDAVRRLASELKTVPVDAEAWVTGDNIIMYEPRMAGVQYDKAPWFVTGKMSEGEALADLYRMVSVAGVFSPVFLLGIELEILNLSVNDGKDYVSSTVVGHMADSEAVLPIESSVETLGMMSTESRVKFAKLCDNIVRVNDGDIFTASGIRVTTDSILVNDHVIAGSASPCVHEMKLQSGIPLSHELWSYPLNGPYEPWSLRDAVIGESAALLYHNGTDVILSPPFMIDMYDGSKIFSTRAGGLKPGTSGGALVALSDMSLLGVHCGSTTRHWIAIAFTRSVYADLLDKEADRSGSKQACADTASGIVTQLKQRGRHREFLSACEQVHALYDCVADTHVGTAVLDGSCMVTTCPAGFYNVKLPSGDMERVEFVQSGGMFSRCEVSTLIDGRRLMLKRTPDNYERVTFVAAGPSDLYISHETVIKQVPEGRYSFMTAATQGNQIPMVGGLVFSTQDGSVLGMFVRDSAAHTTGRLSLCVTFADEVVKPVYGVTDEIQRIFPMLTVASWREGLMDEVFTHTSATELGGVSRRGNLDLAGIGDAVVRTRLKKRLYDSRRRHSEWEAVVQALLTNGRMSRIAAHYGFGKYIRVAPGLVLPATSKAYADVLEALIGAIDVSEETGVIDQVLAEMGLVPSVTEVAEMDLTHAAPLRRASEFGLKPPTSESFGMTKSFSTGFSPVG